MKLILTSDLHGNLPNIDKYFGDVFIISGDICPNFKWDRFDDSMHQLNWLTQTFMPWAANINAKHILLTPGNHDVAFEDTNNQVRDVLSDDKRINLLIDQSTTIDGVSFYGTPWVSPVGNWAFLASGDKMRAVRDMIPKNVNVLISHSPPYGIFDLCPFQKENYGCKHLLNTLPSLTNLKLNVFGHVHSVKPNILIDDGVAFVNAAETVEEIIL